MIETVTMVFALGAFIAYANGANDVSKSIATLAGSGVTDYRRAILWGTLWTGVGGLLGMIISRAMLVTFGRGLLAPTVEPSTSAAIGTIAGAALWVAASTRWSLPVSTTHAIVGSLAGVGAAAYGFAGVNWAAMGDKIAAPLLLSPVLALAITSVILRAWRALGPKAPECLCADIAPVSFAAPVPGAATLSIAEIPEVRLSTGTQEACNERRSSARITVNHLHWMTSGATALARGLNDGPKMVAIILAAAALSGSASDFRSPGFLIITAGMVAGSWMAGRRVTHVLAERVTRMDHREGFVANLVTAALVAPGAALGLPMSTTHVSSGAIMGAGINNDTGLCWTTVRDLLLAWIVTVPGAAVLGISAYGGLRLLGMK